jgi:arylsulfatase A-like enzyme
MTYDLDESLGEIVQALNRLDIANNTYVVFMSDNGAPGGPRNADNNRPLKGGKGTLYEGGVRVPLIIAGPGIEPGYSPRAVSGTDLFATFASWAGVAFESQESEDLAPLLEGKPGQFKRDRPLLFHYPHYGHGQSQTPQTALVADTWKLLRHWETGVDQLFDLETDLGEQKDLSIENPDVFDNLVAALEKRLQETRAKLPIANPDYDPGSPPMIRRKKR